MPAPAPPLGTTPAPLPAGSPAPLAWAATAGASLLALVLLVPPLLGLQRYVITGGSMAGAHDAGSVVFDEVVPTDQLRVGDVITYTPPPASGLRGPLTHRIHAIRAVGGVRVFRTKGDANPAPDPWEFRLTRPTQARVSFGVPHVGRLVALLADRELRMVVIGGPALLIALGALAGLRRERSPAERGPAPATEGARR